MKPQTALDPSPLATLIGNSQPMRQVHRLIARMGKARFPVLILGETGTGKELVARAIHNVGGRGPFVVVDCSSLVGPLMESELFGYAKGAFTGAHTHKLGLLDAANGGTAFFDEVGELPLELQMKLLRLLQEKEYRAVGALAQRSSDFRVIAATHRDLAEQVRTNQFREDLFYRLNVMKLRVPPLRERKADIPALAMHFLARYGNGHRLPDDCMAMLESYDWPGNIRELEHAIQQMVALNSGQWLTKEALPSAIINRLREKQEKSCEPLSSSNGVVLDSSEFPYGIVPLAEVERRAILHALDRAKGDRTVAAAVLQIGRTTLYRKLKQYGL